MPKLQFGRLPARVGDRRVGEGLADDGHRHAVHLLHHEGLEDGIAEIGGLDVLGDDVDLAGEILFLDFLDAGLAIGRFPVQGHDIDPERLAGVDHVLRVAPQRRTGTLPRVAAVEQQRAGAIGLHALDQRRQVGETADLAIGFRCLLEIQEGEGMRVDGVRLETKMLEEVLADQMRHLAELVAETEIDARLAEIDRQQLGMAVGDVQQADVAKFRQVVHLGSTLFGQRQFAVQRHAAGGSHCQDLEKLPTIHAHVYPLKTKFWQSHNSALVKPKKCPASSPAGPITQTQSLLTGDSGSIRKATTWVISSGVSQLCRPKRGMLVHALNALEL